jgi:hypothetical protein
LSAGQVLIKSNSKEIWQEVVLNTCSHFCPASKRCIILHPLYGIKLDF